MDAQVLQQAPPGQGQAQGVFADNKIDCDIRAWEGVLDCGAPGPGREAPALFYQAPLPSNAAARISQQERGCSE